MRSTGRISIHARSPRCNPAGIVFFTTGREMCRCISRKIGRPAEWNRAAKSDWHSASSMRVARCGRHPPLPSPRATRMISAASAALNHGKKHGRKLRSKARERFSPENRARRPRASRRIALRRFHRSVAGPGRSAPISVYPGPPISSSSKAAGSARSSFSKHRTICRINLGSGYPDFLWFPRKETNEENKAELQGRHSSARPAAKITRHRSSDGAKESGIMPLTQFHR